jgi:predicted secreted protein
MADAEIIKLRLNEDHIIDLIGMGNSGYKWIYETVKEDILKVSHQYIVSQNPKPGEPGIERFTFKGIKKGSCLVEFRQVRSWEKDKPPLSVKKFRVNVD